VWNLPPLHQVDVDYIVVVPSCVLLVGDSAENFHVDDYLQETEWKFVCRG